MLPRLRTATNRRKLLLFLLLAALSYQLVHLTARRQAAQHNGQLEGGHAAITPWELEPSIDGQPCSRLQHEFPDLIPPIVHWTTKDGRLHQKLSPIVRSWRRLLDSSNSKSSSDVQKRWHFMHWDDRQISELISKHYPQLSRSYSKLVNGLERSDIGRLVVLHHIGGLYVDTDVELLRDPSPLLRPLGLHGAGLSANFSCRSAVWSQEPLEHAAFIFNISSLISNAVMMSRANHSFLSFVLEHWPPWFLQTWSKKISRGPSDAVFVTGPIMLQSQYENYTALHSSQRPFDWCGNMLAEVNAFQPICDHWYSPSRMKKYNCAEPRKLTELQLRHCTRLAADGFKTKQLPNTSYTVHRFLHLSYKDQKANSGISSFDKLLPITRCAI